VRSSTSSGAGLPFCVSPAQVRIVLTESGLDADAATYKSALPAPMWHPERRAVLAGLLSARQGVSRALEELETAPSVERARIALGTLRAAEDLTRLVLLCVSGNVPRSR